MIKYYSFLYCSLVLVSFFTSRVSLFAQLTTSYRRTVIYGTYPSLNGSTLISSNSDEVKKSVVKSGFFRYGSNSYNTIIINSNGFVEFGASTNTGDNQNKYGNVVAAWWDDLRVSSSGSIDTLTVGESPYRAFIIDFKNVQARIESDLLINFRVFLYETTGSVRIVYGPVQGDLSSYNTRISGVGATVGLVSSSPNSVIDGISGQDTRKDDYLANSQFPEEGTAFLFMPSVIASSGYDDSITSSEGPRELNGADIKITGIFPEGGEIKFERINAFPSRNDNSLLPSYFQTANVKSTYWRLVFPTGSGSSVSDVTVQARSGLFTGTASNFRWLRRDGPGEAWEDLGGNAMGSNLVSTVSTNRLGEFAVAELPASVTKQTRANGNWEDRNTWVGGIAPNENDSVQINHSITLNKDQTVQQLTFQGTAMRQSELILNGYAMTIENEILALSTNNQLTSKTGSKLVLRLRQNLPDFIEVVHELDIQNSADITLTAALGIVDTLRINTGSSLNKSGFNFWYGKTNTISQDPRYTLPSTVLGGGSSTISVEIVGADFRTLVASDGVWIEIAEDINFNVGNINSSGSTLAKLGSSNNIIQQAFSSLDASKQYYARLRVKLNDQIISYTPSEPFPNRILRKTRASGLWNSANTWENNVIPEPKDSVEILHDVRINVPISIQSLTHTSGELTLDSRFTITGSLPAPGALGTRSVNALPNSELFINSNQEVSLPSHFSRLEKLTIEMEGLPTPNVVLNNGLTILDSLKINAGLLRRNAHNILVTDTMKIVGKASINPIINTRTSEALSASHFIFSSGSYAQVSESDAAVLNSKITTNLTLEAWVNARSWNSSIQNGIVVSKYDQAANKGFGLFAGEGGIVEFSVNGNTISTRGIFNMLTDQWYHVSGVYGGNSMYIYINGVLVVQRQGISESILSNDLPLSIGSQVENDVGFSGYIDEVRIWSSQRRSLEIVTGMNQYVYPRTTGLEAYYRMDEPSSKNILYDQTRNRLNANVFGEITKVVSGAWIYERSTEFPTLDAANFGQSLNINSGATRNITFSGTKSFSYRPNSNNDIIDYYYYGSLGEELKAMTTFQSEDINVQDNFDLAAYIALHRKGSTNDVVTIGLSQGANQTFLVRYGFNGIWEELPTERDPVSNALSAEVNLDSKTYLELIIAELRSQKRTTNSLSSSSTWDETTADTWVDNIIPIAGDSVYIEKNVDYNGSLPVSLSALLIGSNDTLVVKEGSHIGIADTISVLGTMFTEQASRVVIGPKTGSNPFHFDVRSVKNLQIENNVNIVGDVLIADTLIVNEGSLDLTNGNLFFSGEIVDNSPTFDPATLPNVTYRNLKYHGQDTIQLTAQISSLQGSNSVTTLAWMEFATNQFFTQNRTRSMPSERNEDTIGVHFRGERGLSYYSRLVISLNGDTIYYPAWEELVHLPNSMTTAQDGLWNNPETWSLNVVPISGERAEIRHKVGVRNTNRRAFEIRDLILENDTLFIEDSLRVTNNILQGTSGYLFSRRVAPGTLGGVLEIERMQVEDFILPSKINKLHTLSIKGNSDVRLEADLLLLDSISVRNGRLLRRQAVSRDIHRVWYVNDTTALVRSRVNPIIPKVEYSNLSFGSATSILQTARVPEYNLKDIDVRMSASENQDFSGEIVYGTSVAKDADTVRQQMSNLKILSSYFRRLEAHIFGDSVLFHATSTSVRIEPRRRIITSGDWSNSAIWQGNILPTASDTVDISARSVFLASNAEIAKLVLGREVIGTNVNTNVAVTLNIQPNVTLTITDSLISNDVSNFVTNSNSELILKKGNYTFPTAINFLENLIIDFPNQTDTLFIDGNLTVNNDLKIYKGVLFIRGNNNLSLGGDLVLSNEGFIDGEKGNLGYKITIFNDAQTQFEFNEKIGEVNKLVVTRRAGAKIQADMIVNDSLIVGNSIYDDVVLERGVFTLVARYTSLLNKGRIDPSVLSSTRSAVQAAQLNQEILTPAIQNHNNLSLEMWFSFSTWINGSNIVSRGGPTNGFQLSMSSTQGRLTWQVFQQPGGQAQIQNDIILNSNSWYHIAVIHEQAGGFLKMYVNGVLVATNNSPQAGNISIDNPTNQTRLIIGSTSGNLTVDEFRYWSKAKTQGEILSQMNSQLEGTESELQIYYRFDEGIGQMVHDHSLFSRHATAASALNWVQSEAKLSTFKPTPVGEEEKNLPNRSNHKTNFSSSVKNFSIQSTVTQGSPTDKLTVLYFDNVPAKTLIPAAIDSVKAFSGRWQVLKQIRSQNITNVFFEVPISELSLTENYSDYDRLVWLYRFSQSDDFVSVGGNIQVINENRFLRSSLALDTLHGALELAVGVRESTSRTVQSGEWSSPLVWLSRSVPTRDDKVVLNHNVTLDQSISIRTLHLQNNIELNAMTQSISLDDSCLVESGGNIVGEMGTEGYRINIVEKDVSERMAWPQNLNTVNHLNISRKSGFSLSDSLAIQGTLSINSGKFFLPNPESVLLLHSDLSLAVDTGIQTSIGSKVIIGESSQGRATTFEMPLRTFVLNNLIVDRQEGIELLGDLIINEKLIHRNGKIFKELNGLAVREVEHTLPLSQIIEPLSVDTVAANLAVRFTGIGTGGIKIEPNTAFLLGNPLDVEMTVEAWIYPDVISSQSEATIIAHYNGSEGWALILEKDGFLGLRVGAGQSNVNFYGQQIFSLKPGKWYHVAASIGKSDVRLYVDGVQILRQEKIEPVIQAPISETIQIASFNTGFPFNGIVEEVKIWSEEHLASQIRNGIHSQLSGDEDDLKLYMRMDEGTATNVYDYSLSGLSGSFISVNNQAFVHSNAPIGDFLPNPTSVQIFSVPSGQSVNIPSLAVDVSTSIKMRLQTLASQTGNIRIGFYENPPIPIGSSPRGIDTIRYDLGYWKITPASPNFTLEGIRLILPFINVSTEKQQDKERYVFLFRIGPSAQWIVQNADLKGRDGNDTLVASGVFPVRGYMEVVLAQRKDLRIYNRPPVFGEKSTDVTVSVLLDGFISGLTYEAQFEVSESINFPTDETFTSPFSRKGSGGDISYNLALSEFLQENKDYYVRTTVRVGGIGGALINVLSINTFSTKERTLEETPDTKETVIEQGVSPEAGIAISNFDGRPENLYLTYVKSDQTIMSVTRYSETPLDGEQLMGAHSVKPKPFYWSIQANIELITEARLYFPLEDILNTPVEPEDLIADTVNARWFKRDNPASPWVDITDEKNPVVTLNGKRMLRTSILEDFSDFIIAHKREIPKTVFHRTPEILFPNVDFEIEPITAKIVQRINTGFEPTQVNVHLSQNIESLGHADNLKDSLFEPLRRVPLITDTAVTTQPLEENKIYYYLTESKSTVGVSRSDTGWFFTMFPAITNIDTVVQGVYSVSKNSSLHIQNIQFEVDITEASGLPKGFPVITKYYLKEPPGSALPQNIAHVNSRFWSILPTTEIENKLLPNMWLSYPNQKGQILIKENSVLPLIPISEFPNGTNLEFMSWLKRKDKTDSWENIGGQVVELNGQEYFMAETQGSELIGDYALGSAIPASIPVVIEDIKVQNIGKKKGRLTFSLIEERGNLGLEVVVIHKGQETIVANYKTGPVTLKGMGTVLNTKRKVSVVAQDLEYGETYFFRIRAYDIYGNIYDHNEYARLTMPVSSEFDPVFENKVFSNYPNPFTNTTTIAFELDEDQTVTLAVYDVLGRQIARLLNKENLSRGRNEVIFSSQQISTGIYFYEIKATKFREVRKMINIR